MFKFFITICFCSLLQNIHGLDNGLAITPPMGWLSWERFRCVTDCDANPHDCLTAELIKDQAYYLKVNEFDSVGYEYVIIDDCWLASSRDVNGRLQADATRFPGGLKPVVDYVHDLGLKFGIYNDYGTNTCAGYPGSIDTLELDAQTFADWGVDFLKTDSCYAGSNTAGYFETSDYLNATGRPILYSCCMVNAEGLWGQYEKAEQHCNTWRISGDIDDSWDSVKSIVSFVIDNQDELVKYAGPGHWNDPDMLIIGNYGLSLDQSKSQMTIWCIIAAPLLMSTDLKNISPEHRAILSNKEAIRINQDRLYIQGKHIGDQDDIHIWTRPVTTDGSDDTSLQSLAIGLVSYRTDGNPFRKTIKLSDFDLHNELGYTVTNIFESESHTYVPDEEIVFFINPTGCVFLRVTPIF